MLKNEKLSDLNKKNQQKNVCWEKRSNYQM